MASENMYARIATKLTSVSGSVKKDESLADRLNSRYTVMILGVFAVAVTASAYFGNPITCWAPVHFTGSHVKYAKSYCWVKNTYYLPMEQDVNVPHKSEERKYVKYYQWIPFILIAQAVLFYFPSMTWHALNSQAGVDADNILESAAKLSDCKQTEKHATNLSFIAKQIYRFTNSRRHFNKMKSCFSYLCSRRGGGYLLALYLFCKMLFIANVLFQMFIMNHVLGTKYNLYGFEVMKSVINDHDWANSPFVAFPRITLCDFNIRRLGNIHRYTIQCVLPLNLYIEKIYIFLWFWFVFVAAVTCFDFVVWLLRAFCKDDAINFAKSHIEILPPDENSLTDDEREEFDKNMDEEKENFIRNSLSLDGIFLLRIIAHNVNGSIATDIGTALFQIHCNTKYKITPKSGLNKHKNSEVQYSPQANTQSPVLEKINHYFDYNDGENIDPLYTDVKCVGERKNTLVRVFLSGKNDAKPTTTGQFNSNSTLYSRKRPFFNSKFSQNNDMTSHFKFDEEKTKQPTGKNNARKQLYPNLKNLENEIGVNSGNTVTSEKKPPSTKQSDISTENTPLTETKRTRSMDFTESQSLLPPKTHSPTSGAIPSAPKE